MPEQVALSKPSLSLRERAETALRASRTDVAQTSAEEIKKLVHELQLHQIELELQNEELRHLYDFAPVGYLTLDRDATVLQANLTAASVLAAEGQKLIGRKFTHFVAPNSLDAFYLHHQAALESGTKQICDLLLRRADGNLFPAQIETIYAEDPSTRARHCRSTISDITERRKAEQALAGSHAELERRIIERTAELALNNERLKAEIVERAQVEQAARQSEARFHAIFHQAIVGVAQTDLGGHFICVNEYYCRMLGYAEEELLQLRMQDITHPDDLPANLVQFHALVAGGPDFEVEKRYLRKDGSELWVTNRVNAIRDAVGKPESVVAISMDVTEHNRAEQALHESEARKAAMLNASLDGIIAIEHNGRILEFNPAAEQIFGYRRDEVVGKEMATLIVPPALQGRHRRGLQRYVATGERSMLDRRIEMIAMRHDGSEFPVELAIVRIGDRHSSMFIGFVRDITERARAEAEMKARTRQERVVADLSRKALAGCDLRWLIREAVGVVAQVLEIEFSKVLELTPAGDQLVLRAGVGWAEDCVGVSRVPARGDSQAGYTLQRGEPVLVEDLAKETRFRAADLLLEHSAVSGMSVVIHGRGEPYGVLSAHTATKRRFNNHEAHFLQSIADVLAEAIVRRQLEEELLAIANREQLRIGQDLHDGLCQHLAGIEFRTGVLADKLTGDPDARQEAERIGELLREGMHQARILSRGLAPVDLEANGLMSALSELATSCGQLYGIDCKFHCDRPVLIATQNTASHLYRIAQEAINNAVRHGHAKTIAIELQNGDTEAVLSVTNDGAPLPTKLGRSGGMGLHIMRYRAEMIGAMLRIVSTAQGKTAVICSFKP